MAEKSFLWTKLNTHLHNHLTSVFVLMGIIITITSAFLVQDIYTAMRDAELVYDRSLRGLDLIGELQYQSQDDRQYIVRALTTEDSTLATENVALSDEASDQVTTIIQEYKLLVSNEEEIIASQALEQNWNKYLEIRDEVIEAVLSGNSTQAVQLDLTAGISSFNAVDNDLHEIKALFGKQAQSRQDDLRYTFNLSLFKVGIILVLTLILAAVSVTIIERGKRLRVIQQSEAKLDSVIESINDGMFVVAHDGTIELVNQAAEDRWGQGRGQMLGRTLTDVLPNLKNTPVLEAIKEAVRTGRASTTQNVGLQDDQTERIYEARLFPYDDGTTVFFNDVTDRQRAEDERLRLSKLESIGLLAGGIAHDFNNIMTGVLGYISFAKLDLDQDNPIYDRLAEAELAAIEAKNLTQQLLTFAKGGAPVKQMTSIADLLVESATFVLRGSNVRCEWEIPEDLWPVDVDTGQINQVIHNLVINAIQSMPDGGVLTIRGENMILGSSTDIRGASLDEGFYVKLSFADQGVGMTPEQLEQIYDPYFTTKATGTGLGLTTVFTIINRHDGAITVDSTPGEGTSFDVYLPASTHPHEVEDKKQEVDEQTTIEEGHGKILIMDDEAVIRELAAKSLAKYGYEVHTSSDGAQVIEMYREALEQNARFDVVIMDLTIPGGMGGEEAISHLKQLDPGIKAIVSSGYHNASIMANFKEYGFCDVVAKPYRVQDLFEAIKDVLNQPNGNMS